VPDAASSASSLAPSSASSVSPALFAFATLGNLFLALIFDDVCLFAVGDHQLLADDHLHKARLVRQLFKLQLQLIREEVLYSGFVSLFSM
jgi:hypothetical protein